MLDWISKLLTGAAYDAAIYSVDVASHNGMYQMEEPVGLREISNIK